MRHARMRNRKQQARAGSDALSEGIALEMVKCMAVMHGWKTWRCIEGVTHRMGPTSASNGAQD